MKGIKIYQKEKYKDLGDGTYELVKFSNPGDIKDIVRNRYEQFHHIITESAVDQNRFNTSDREHTRRRTAGFDLLLCILVAVTIRSPMPARPAKV